MAQSIRPASIVRDVAVLMKTNRRAAAAIAASQVPVPAKDRLVITTNGQPATWQLSALPYTGDLGSSLNLSLNGLELDEATDYSVNYTTGLVTFSTAQQAAFAATPTPADVLTADYWTTDELIANAQPVDLGSFTITDTFAGHAANTDLNGLTTSDGKATWTAQVGIIRTAFTTGGAYSASTASTYTIDSSAVSSTPNGLTQADVTPVGGTFTGIVGRYVDINNFFTFQNRADSATEGKLVARVAGISADVVTGLPVGAAKKTMGLEFVGDTINLYVSGSLIWTGTDSALNTATKFGLWSNTNLVPQEWDNFQFTGY